MTERIDLAKTLQMLGQAEDILLICHKNPDGDTLGSAGALQHALQAQGKRVGAWTVNDYASLEKCRQSGVDNVITDRPGTIF